MCSVGRTPDLDESHDSQRETPHAYSRGERIACVNRRPEPGRNLGAYHRFARHAPHAFQHEGQPQRASHAHHGDNPRGACSYGHIVQQAHAPAHKSSYY